MWYENLWWWLLYEMCPVEEISLDVVNCYIDNVIKDSYFDEMDVNSKLAAVGLWLMSMKM